MTPERWRRIEELFDRAVELAPPARAALLESACAGDDELRSEVEQLVASRSGAVGSLQCAIAHGAALFEQGVSASRVGTRLGPYRLREVIGEGGMGTVYRATRDDAEYQREVAIKILRAVAASPALIARLRDERQLLASLDHAGIVRLLDGGSTDEGLPYLVMEHIAGVPVTEYARDLPLRARIELVIAIGTALQYAHQKLIVHRDVKPRNIMVDDSGTAKLLDFGIAKLLDPHAGSREAETATGMPLFTVEYASPEQARGEPVSVATDVYSLGAVLYELLTGRTPQQRGATLVDTLANICNRDPPRPSVIAPAELSRQLAGDLDNIVLKALQKSPAHRYPSVAMLVDDMQRYLDGRPVSAREATLGYRAGKFVARHRGKVALAGLVGLALGTATVVSIVQARRADRHAAEAERERLFLLRERGTQEIALGHPSRALAYYAEVLRGGMDSPALRFLVAEAMRPLALDVTVIPFERGARAVAWSPDGSHLAIAGQDGVVAIHDFDGREVVAIRARQDYSQLLRFSADGGTVVAAFASGNVYGWDAASGKQRFHLEVSTEAWNVTWGASDTALAAARGDGEIRILDLASGRTIATTTIAMSQPSCVAISSDLGHVAIATRSGEIYTWNVRTGEARRVAAHAGGTSALRYAGDKLYSGGADHAILVQAADDGRVLASLGGGNASVSVIDVDGAGMIATNNGDETASIWDPQTGALVATFGRAMRPVSLEWSPDGEHLVTTNRTGSFALWDPRGNLELSLDGTPGPGGAVGAAGSALEAHFSRDGRFLVTMSSRDVRLRRVEPGPLLARLAVDGNPYAIAGSPDERHIAIVGAGTAGVWDLATKNKVATFALGALRGWDVAWSPDGHRIAVAGDDGHASIRDASGAMIQPLVGHRGIVNSIRWSHDGARIVTAGDDHTIRVWDAASGRQVFALHHPDRVKSAAWRPDDLAIATASSDHVLRQWDATTGMLRNTIDAGAMQLLSATFDPTGRSLVATSHGGDVAVFDIESGARTLVLGGHTDAVPTAAWSSDGSLIATAGYDGTLRIWDAESGTLLAARPTGSLMSIEWSRDGTRLFDAAEEGQVRIWDAHRASERVEAIIDTIAQRVPYRLVGSQLERTDRR